MSTEQKQGIKGLEYLPEPILTYIQRKAHSRVYLPQVYHVTELTGCLRRAFFRRMFKSMEISSSSAWWFYRGNLFDFEWTPLFERNQGTGVVQKEEISIVGTYDFVYQNEKLGDDEAVLHDLKSTQSLYYLRQEDFPHKSHVEQVQAYLGIFKYNKGRIIYYDFSDDPVQFNIEKDEGVLDRLFERARLLGEALEKRDPAALPFPEEKYLCKPKYCSIYYLCIKDQMIRRGVIR